jgi:hypothetical protein
VFFGPFAENTANVVTWRAALIWRWTSLSYSRRLDTNRKRQYDIEVHRQKNSPTFDITCNSTLQNSTLQNVCVQHYVAAVHSPLQYTKRGRSGSDRRKRSKESEVILILPWFRFLK